MITIYYFVVMEVIVKALVSGSKIIAIKALRDHLSHSGINLSLLLCKTIVDYVHANYLEIYRSQADVMVYANFRIDTNDTTTPKYYCQLNENQSLD